MAPRPLLKYLTFLLVHWTSGYYIVYACPLQIQEDCQVAPGHCPAKDSVAFLTHTAKQVAGGPYLFNFIGRYVVTRYMLFVFIIPK